jgi:hypothetical protein
MAHAAAAGNHNAGQSREGRTEAVSTATIAVPLQDDQAHIMGWMPPASQPQWMPQSKEGSTAMDILAIDLGKRSFNICGVDGDGVIVSRKVGRSRLAQGIDNLASAVIAWKRAPVRITGGEPSLLPAGAYGLSTRVS